MKYITFKMRPQGRKGDRRPGAGSFPLIWTLVLLAAAPLSGQKAVDFALQDLAGRTQKLGVLAPGHVVLINFWATWCVPCAKELPHLQRLQDLYAGRGLRVLAVSIDSPDRRAAVSAFIGRYGYTMPVLLDSDSRVVAIYDPSLVLPYSVVLDRRGEIRFVHQGYSPGDESVLEEEIAGLLVEPETKPAGGVSVKATDALLVRLPHADTPASSQVIGPSRAVDQLDLTASLGPVLAGVRADANAGLSPWDPHFRLAKRFVQASSGGLRALAGDYYYSLGRGLVLSLLKVFESEGLDYVVDTTIDGGLLSFGSGPLGAGVFGGWIERPDDLSVRDKVLGGSAGWSREGLGTVRVQGVMAALEPGAEFANRRAGLGSLSLEIPDIGGVAEVYGEFSLIRRRAYDAAVPLDGHGLYLESRLRLGGLSLLAEMKDYREFNFEYGRPPLLEAEELDILADQFDTDRTDMTGWSLRLDYRRPGSDTLFYAKGLLVEDDPTAHPLFGAYERGIRHVFAGVEKRFANGAYLNALAGWRSEDDTSVAFLATDGRTFHYQADAVWPLGGRLSLEFDGKQKTFDGRFESYAETRAALSLHRSPRWVLSLLYERSSDPAVLFWSGKKDFWAGQAELRFARACSLRLFVGATKGSTRCAGGVCRVFPPFEGVRLDGLVAF